MSRVRPTIRCLLDELRDGLEAGPDRVALSSGHLADLGPRALSDLSHPLLDKASRVLEGRTPQELHNLEIAAVRDQTWYRIKVGQWRGAAWIDKNGIPWICAAGLRRDGDAADFYSWFEARCANGSEIFLPSGDDLKRLRLENASAAEQNRLLLLRMRVVQSLVAATKSGEVQTVALPSSLDEGTLRPMDGARLVIAVTPHDVSSINELTLSIEITDYAGSRYEDVLIEVQSAMPGVRGREKVPTSGQMKGPLVASRSTRWWPREVPTPH